MELGPDVFTLGLYDGYCSSQWECVGPDVMGSGLGPIHNISGFGCLCSVIGLNLKLIHKWLVVFERFLLTYATFFSFYLLFNLSARFGKVTKRGVNLSFSYINLFKDFMHFNNTYKARVEFLFG